MSTFLESYQAYLESLLERGGDPKAMEAAVAEFNAIENPGWAPSGVYQSWQLVTDHSCGACGNRFKQAILTKPSDERRCASCFTNGKTTTHVEAERARPPSHTDE